MIQKKICMIGSFAVGKTSLVARFVKSIFSDKYHTTVGVKIDKKVVTVGAQEVTLMLWDLAGEDEFNKVQLSYLRGSSGYLLVVDGTRSATLDKALAIRETIVGAIGEVPFILVLNKADLVEDWELSEQQVADLTAKGWQVLKGSAKTGEGVEEAFLSLAQKMVNG